MQQLPLGVRWREHSVFANYLPGGNAAAVEQLLAELNTVGGGTTPAIWLWGAAGTGKSHLLQAACAHLGAQKCSAAYFPLREVISLQPEALAGCEQLNLVCVDDVQQAAGDAGWELALFNLYNGLQEQRGRLLLTADVPPGAVKWRLPDLASRLGASLVLGLRSLDDTQQMDVLKLRAHNRGLQLPDETARFLLSHYPRDLRTQCDLLDALDTASLAARRRLTIPFIKTVISQKDSQKEHSSS